MKLQLLCAGMVLCIASISECMLSRITKRLFFKFKLVVPKVISIRANNVSEPTMLQILYLNEISNAVRQKKLSEAYKIAAEFQLSDKLVRRTILDVYRKKRFDK